MEELIERLRLYAEQGIQTGTARITQRGAANLLEQQAAEIDGLKKIAQESIKHDLKMIRQRDALQAKHSAMEKQEPVAYWIPKAEQFCLADKSGRPFAKAWEPLYTAPKVASEQVEAAWRAGWAACRDAEYVGQEAEDETWGMSETCANADWENATPKVAQPLTGAVLLAEDLDTCRQWFNSVQDTNGGYLVPADYVLAEKLYRLLGMRVPSSITNATVAHNIGGQQP